MVAECRVGGISARLHGPVGKILSLLVRQAVRIDRLLPVISGSLTLWLEEKASSVPKLERLVLPLYTNRRNH